MTKTRTAGIAVLSRRFIPQSFSPMADYAKRGNAVYGMVKKAALAGRIESYCLFENGRMRSRPRRWVNPVEVDSLLSRREESPRLFAERSQAAQPPAPAPVESASVAALVEAVRMLTLEIEAAAAVISEALDRSRPEREPATFGES